jgi:hypothetical protein
MSEIRGNTIPWILALVSGVVMYLQFYFDVGVFNSLAEMIKTTTIVISTIAMGIGFLNLVSTHVKYLQSTREVAAQKVMSVYWLFCCLVTFVTGVIPPMLSHPVYNFMMERIRVNANIAASALFPPWILVAGYRAFKIRNIESLFFTLSAALVALGNVPVGGLIWSGFPVIGGWITQKLIAAVFRAITIGIGIGVIGMALRVYLRMERALYRRMEV